MKIQSDNLLNSQLKQEIQTLRKGIEKGEEAEMPKQKDLYDFDNMTNDDLDRLINEANEVLMNRKKDRMLKYLDDAINSMKEFLQFDGNCAITSEGYSTVDIINELKELKAYYN